MNLINAYFRNLSFTTMAILSSTLELDRCFYESPAKISFDDHAIFASTFAIIFRLYGKCFAIAR